MKDVKPDIQHRDSRPLPSNGGSNGRSQPHSNGGANGQGRPNGDVNSNGHANANTTDSANGSNGLSLDEQRAARLAAMSSSATELYESRTKSLAQRAEEEKREMAKDAQMRAKYGKEEASAGFFKQHAALGLSESLARRAGKGLQKDI